MDFDKEIELLEVHRANLLDQIRPIQELIQVNYDKIQELKELKSKQKLESNSFTWLELLEENGHSSDQVKYKECDRKLRSIGLGSSGFFPDINQKCVRFSVSSDADADKLTKIKNGLLEVLPFLIKVDKGNLTQVVRFDLFENTLSEHGSYKVCYQESTNKWFLDRTVYGRTSTIYSTEDLDEFLKYIKEHHPYD